MSMMSTFLFFCCTVFWTDMLEKMQCIHFINLMSDPSTKPILVIRNSRTCWVARSDYWIIEGSPSLQAVRCYDTMQ